MIRDELKVKEGFQPYSKEKTTWEVNQYKRMETKEGLINVSPFVNFKRCGRLNRV